MEIKNVFINLRSDEFNKATGWYKHLENAEQERVVETLKAINGTSFFVREGLKIEDDVVKAIIPLNISMATIVAGSSVDGLMGTYKDIDLFLLPKESLHSEKFGGVKLKMLVRQLDGKLPPYSYGIIYKDDVNNMALIGEEDPRNLAGLGARVTVSVFHELEGFDRRRNGKLDDILKTGNAFSGAEEIILHNRDKCSKFLVLGRQYAVS